MAVNVKVVQFFYLCFVIIVQTHSVISRFSIKVCHASKSPQFVTNNADDLLYPMILRLYDDYIYQCTIYPNETNIFYQCNESNIFVYNSTNSIHDNNFESNSKLSIEYNSPNRLLIDSIKIYENNTYYEINEFCVPWQYHHLLFNITSRRLYKCKNTAISGYQLPKYRDLSIGTAANITYHTINLLYNFRSYDNSTMEAFVTPPSVKQFGITVSPNYYHNYTVGDPQTRVPVTLTLYWFNKMYQCIIHPTKPGQQYICNIGDSNVSVSDIDPSRFGTYVYVLKMQKEVQDTDALKISRITVTDITNTSHNIENFCVSEYLQKAFKICSYHHMHNKRCSGYLGTDLGGTTANQYLNCEYACIDGDGCGANSLLFYFTEDLYTLNNMDAQIRIAVNENAGDEEEDIQNTEQPDGIIFDGTQERNLEEQEQDIDDEINNMQKSNNNVQDRFNGQMDKYDKQDMIYMIVGVVLSVVLSIVVIILVHIMINRRTEMKALEDIRLLLTERGETPSLTDQTEEAYDHLSSDEQDIHVDEKNLELNDLDKNDEDWVEVENPAHNVIEL